MGRQLLIWLAFVTLGVSPALGSFQLTFRSNYGGTATVVDNGLRDEDPTVGSIVVGGVGGTPLVLNGYTFRAYSAYAGRVAGTDYISMNTMVTGWGAGSVSILASMNGILNSQPSGLFSSNATISFVTPLKVCNTATVQYGAYVDTLNRLGSAPLGTSVSTPASGYIDGNSSTVAASAIAFSSDEIATAASVFAMSLYMQASGLLANVGNRISFQGGLQFVPIPEPSAMVIWFFLGWWVLIWHRRSR